MSKWAIEVEGVAKRYRLGEDRSRERLADLFMPWRKDARSREFLALGDVSFKIEKGESVGIIGRNGAGKSTLLKILARITAPTRGRVLIDGRVGTLLEVGTGFHPELSGRENVFLSGAILGLSRAEIKARFDEIVEFSEVGKFLDTPVKRYSSGMQVRLAFSVALYLDPEILIIDEVLAVGDLGFQHRSVGRLRNASASEGRTVLFVSHSLEAVKRLCQRVIVLDGGGIKFDGPADQAVAFYRASVPIESAPLEYESLNDRLVDQDGVAQVASAEWLDEQECPKSSFSPGDTACLRVHFELTKPVTNLSVLFSLLMRDSAVATTHDIVTDIHEVVSPKPLASGYRGSCELELSNLPLKAGIYSPFLRFEDAGGATRYGIASRDLPKLSIVSDETDVQLGLIAIDYAFDNIVVEAEPAAFADLEVIGP